MELTIVDNYEAMSDVASNIIIETITNKPDALLCLSTGDTPKQTYQNIRKEYVNNPHLFSSVRLIKFDEWCDIPATDESSCENYLYKHLVEPLKIGTERYFTYGNRFNDAEKECVRINTYLLNNGPIDLILLGLGLNGHIGLIEPNTNLKRYAHVSKLSKMTQQHAMFGDRIHRPEYGITLGMLDIFNAKRALMLVEGVSKKHIIKKVMNGNITTKIPASLLWLHSNVDLLIDRNVI